MYYVIHQGVTKIESKPDKGVTQGSVLGPILYIIFVSNFPDYFRKYCSMLMYTYDTVLLLKNTTPRIWKFYHSLQ